MLTVNDLFSGCGGLSLGFDYLDEFFDLQYALDKWAVACKSYKANFHSVDVDCRDALEVKPSEIPKADVIIGGPPCQEFSIGKETRRNYDMCLVNWFLKVIDYMQPRFWIMENVPPLKTLLNGSFRKEIYRMSDFGVPQVRKRLFCGDFNEPRKNPIDVTFPAVVATEYKGLGNRKDCRLGSAFKRKCLIPEAKLVQTFPGDFIVLGSLKDQYIQIGNAVPPLFSYYLAEALVKPQQQLLVAHKGD